MIVRELLAKFGFDVDTAAIDKWNSGVEKGKAVATQGMKAAAGLAKQAAAAGAGAAEGAAGALKMNTNFQALPKTLDAATVAAARFKAAQNAALASTLNRPTIVGGPSPLSPIVSPNPARANAFAAAIERSRSAMLQASATASTMAAKLDTIFDGVQGDMSVLRQRAMALGPAFNEAQARADLLASKIREATAAGALMTDVRLASLAVNFAEAASEVERMNHRAASSAHMANSAYSVLQQTLIGVGVSAAAMFAAFTVSNAFRDYTQWEGALNALKAVSGATAQEFDSMREKALKLGVDTTFSTKEATEGMVELARAGMNTAEVMASIDGTLNLASAGQISVARAAEVTSDTLNMFALKAADAGRISDLFAAGANASSIGVNQIAESMSYAGAVAHSYGQSVEDVTAAIAILGNAGIKGSTAGTGIAAMMNRLAAPSSKDAIKYIKMLGLNVKDAHGNMRPLPELLAQVQRGLKGMGNVDRGKAVKEIFGEEAMKDISSFLGMAPDKLKATTEAVHKNAGEAERLSKILNQGLGKAWDELISTLDAFAKRMLLVVAPAMEGVIRPVTESIKEFGNWVDSALKAAKESGELSDKLKLLRLAIALLVPGFAVALLKAYGAVIMASVVRSVWAAVTATWAWVAANGVLMLQYAGIVLLTAGFVLLGLVVQDLITWLNGGESALGDIFDSGYDNGYAFMEWLEQMGPKVVEWLYNMTHGFVDSAMAFIDQAVAFITGLWDGLVTTVSNFIDQATAMANAFVTGMVTSWDGLTAEVDRIFSSVYDTVAGWIEQAVGKVGELVTSITGAASKVPGLSALVKAGEVVGQGLVTAAVPMATPSAEAGTRSGNTTSSSVTQTNQVSVTVSPPPGATSPAAYGQAAAAGANDGQRRALANGVRALPKQVR